MKKTKKNKQCYNYVGVNLLKSELEYISLYLQVIGKVNTVSVKPNKSLLIRNIIARWVDEKGTVLPAPMLIQSIVTKEQAYWQLQKTTVSYPDFLTDLRVRLKKEKINSEYINQIITALDATHNKQ